MKLLFSIIAAALSMGTGYYYARNMRLHITTLESLVTTLTQMDIRMRYALTPLPALLRVGVGSCAPLFTAMAGFVEEGMSALEAYHAAKDGAALAVNEADERVMTEFFQNLGLSDCDAQRGNSRLALERLGALLEEAIRNEKVKGRMYRSLGLLGAAAVAIVLL